MADCGIRGAGRIVLKATALLMLVSASGAMAGVELLDAGVEEPPEPPVSPMLFSYAIPQQEPQSQFHAAWTVGIEQVAIQQPAASVELNLPDREPVLVSRLHWEARAGFIPSPDGYAGQIPDPDAELSAFSWRWYGKSDRGYTVALTLAEGHLAGRIWAPANVHYALEPAGDAITLGLIRPGYWATHPPGWDEPPAEARSASTASESAVDSGAMLAGTWDLTCSGPLPAGQHPIDVLVMYTPNMIDGTSPMGYPSLAAFSTAVQSSIDDANQALRNVGIYSYAYALRAIEPADSIDYSVVNISDALGEFSGIKSLNPPVAPWCTYPGNSHVSGRRTTMWADVVALARAGLPGDTTCGVSRGQKHIVTRDCPRDPGPGYDPFSYLVFNPKCGPDQLNLAHELGHLLGMEHDPLNAKNIRSPNAPSCPWSFGHRLGNAAVPSRYHFRTVMAYHDTPLSQQGPPGPPSCGTPQNCPQIDAYSDPLQDWHGENDGINPPPWELQPFDPLDGAPAIGEPNHPTWRPSQATQTLPRLAPIVAAFRPRPDLIFADGFEN